jgi:hypothetical protein
MKKLFVSITFLCYGLLAFSQGHSITIMIVPSDIWCKNNNCLTTWDNQGKTVYIPDYKKALLNSDLALAISQINGLFADRGFELKQLEQALKSLDAQSAEDAVFTTKSGAELAESPIDKLRKIVNADIWITISWDVGTAGPKFFVQNFILSGIDAYTDKSITEAQQAKGPEGFSGNISSSVSAMVESKMDVFTQRLENHFEQLENNGREISMIIRTATSFDGDLESEYNGTELGVLIEDWIYDNTKYHVFSTGQATENRMVFENVRIEFYTDQGRKQDARRWGMGLQKYLQTQFQIVSKVMTKGQGQVQIVIGEK